MNALTHKQLYELYYGTQDKKFEEMDGTFVTPQFVEILEARTFTYESTAENRKIKHRISDNFRDPLGWAYANLRITPNSACTAVSLCVGGQRFQRHNLFRFQDKDIEVYDLSAGRCFPRLQWHDIDLEIETCTDTTITISYDVVLLTNYTERYVFDIFTEQYIEPYILNDTTENTLNCPYNHPVVRLYAYLPEDTEDARLIINGHDNNLVFTKETEHTKMFVLDFEYSINFSRIDTSVLKLKTSTPHPDKTAHVFAITKHIALIQQGMAGLMFSK